MKVKDPARYKSFIPEESSIEAERLKRLKVLAAGYRLFAKQGFNSGTAGHITVRDPEFKDCFWLAPYGISFKQVKVSDLVLCNSEGVILEGKHNKINKAAFYIHANIHTERDDVNAIAHAHSLFGKSFSVYGKKLLPITQDSCAFYEDHSVYRQYNGLVLDDLEGQRLVNSLGDNKAMILQNHGLLTVGKTLEAAIWWYLSMEECCQVQILVESTTNKINLIEHETALKVRDEYIGFPLSGYFKFRPYWQDLIAEQPELIE